MVCTIPVDTLNIDVNEWVFIQNINGQNVSHDNKTIQLVSKARGKKIPTPRDCSRY